MNIEELIEIINADFEKNGAYDRYPVRFFSMKYERETSSQLIQLKQRLNETELFDIKVLLNHDDAWITPDALTKAIASLSNDKNYIVVGFSEYARFLNRNDFIAMIVSLLDIENISGNQKRRIFIPCFALFSQIRKVIETYHRRIDAYNPLLNETNIEDLPRIFFVDEGLNLGNTTNEIFSSVEWFGLWRNLDIDTRIPILCSSKTLAYFYSKASPDNVYNIKRINTFQDVLLYMYSIEGIRDPKTNSSQFYNKLINLINAANGKGLNEVILTQIKASSLDSANLYGLWKASDEFDRWLIQNYILIYGDKDSYLYAVLDSLTNLTDKEFVESVYITIFENKSALFVQQRLEILASITKHEKDITFTNKLVSFFNAYLKELIKSKTTITLETIDFTKEDIVLSAHSASLKEALSSDLIPFITSFSVYERQLIIWLVRLGLITISQIQNTYPELWNYINYYSKDTSDLVASINDYFNSYRKLRLALETAALYDSELDHWNHDENSFYKWYFNSQIEHPETILKKTEFKGNTYVFDGVGAEFLGYIAYLLDVGGYTVEIETYAKSHLPSITSVAKNYYTMQHEWLLDYDQKAVHGEIYHHVTNLEQSLSEIKRMVSSVIANDTYDSLAITADHGASVGHKINKKEKKYNFKNADHDGRCLNNKEKQSIKPEKDYILYDDEFGNQWVISLNQRSLNDTSKYVVHGGATPEEILVPMIIARKGKRDYISYKVHPLSLKVSGLKKIVEFRITPMPTPDIKVLLRAPDGTDTMLSYDDDNKSWRGMLNTGIEQDIEVIIDNNIFKYRTVPPTKMGDDLFDD